MPAEEKTWRPLRRMHAVFGVSSIAMFVGIIWMMADDHSREWKAYQRDFRQIEAAELRYESRRVIDRLGGDDRLAELDAEIAQAEAELAESEDRYEQLQDRARELRDQQFVRNQASSFARADRDAARSRYNVLLEAGASPESPEVQEALRHVEAMEQRFAQAQLALEEIETELAEAEAELAEFTAARDEAVERRNRLRADYDRLQDALAQVAPDSWATRTLRRIMEWPILDGFNTQTLNVEQIWLPDLTINYGGFENVARFDRCVTCHRAIERVDAAGDPAFPCERPDADSDPEQLTVPIAALEGAEFEQLLDWTVLAGGVSDELREACLDLGDRIEQLNGDRVAAPDALDLGNPESPLAELYNRGETDVTLGVRRGYPNPFCTHPRPNLFVGTNSPHPMARFGCTICHEGQGHSTGFTYASHTPNSPAQARRWEQQHDWHDVHFWDFPQLPTRLIEASCIRCHHTVEELGEGNRDYGATAPQLVEGYRLVRDFACFGCHEINGFAGGRQIGPDLRLEPNYDAFREAARTLLDSGALPADAQRLAREIIEDPMRAEPRAQLAAAVAERPALSRDLRDAGTALVVDSPGQQRRAGPSLRWLPEKTNEQWAYAWIMEPAAFRPSTRMPQFFLGLRPDHYLSNQDNPEGHRFQPIEVRGIVAYLFHRDESYQPYELEQPAGGYQPNVERGRRLFSERGCLACHSHNEFPVESAAFGPQIDPADFGPDLSDLSAKLTDQQGRPNFAWLYTWLREPTRHHPRTRMPYMFLELFQENGENVDPAADIAAWLLSIPAADENGRPFEFTLPDIRRSDLHDLARMFLRRSFTTAETEQILSGGARAARTRPLSELAVRVLNDVLAFEQAASPDSEAAAAIGRVLAEEQNGERRRLGPELRRQFGAAVARYEQATPIADALTYLMDLDDLPPSPDLERPLAEIDDLVVPTQQRQLHRQVRDLGRALRDLHDVVETEAQAERRLGDAVELVSDQPLEGAARDQALLRYVGRRTISRYGCFGCHDIPGFENSRPIGTALTDWGRKEPERLDFAHVLDYLEERPDQRALHDQLEGHISRATEDQRRRYEFFHHSLEEHRRPGFLWQKLRDPRSYDYQVTSTEIKPYDERLLMPRFSFYYDPQRQGESDEAYRFRIEMENQRRIEAIATFILGLVADAPAEQYVYRPEGPQRDEVEGLIVFERFNCAGCHVLDFPQYTVDTSVWDGQVPPPAADPGEFDFALRGVADMLGNHPQQQRPGTFSFHGMQIAAEEYPGELSEAVYELWLPTRHEGTQYLPSDRVLVSIESEDPAERYTRYVETQREGFGGDFAWRLARRIAQEGAAGGRPVNQFREAWQYGPPPLVGEGARVQTPWLHGFLLSPQQLRYQPLLRMPRFNMSSEEAQLLASFFAARDHALYPYQEVEETTPDYLARAATRVNQFRADEGAPPDDLIGDRYDYLGESWTMLTRGVCASCHTIAGNPPGGDPAREIFGPDLNVTYARLRPQWTALWLAGPARITPITAMPQNLRAVGSDETLNQYFHGTSELQLFALRDALMNYPTIVDALAASTRAQAGQTAAAGGQRDQRQDGDRPPPGQAALPARPDDLDARDRN